MCTVTLVTFGAVSDFRWRLSCNRDESHTRPAALAPKLHTFGSRQALLPVDPPSGGTWIAVNDAALAVTLLNVNPPGSHRPTEHAEVAEPVASRGAIIPSLLHCDDARAAADLARAIEPRRYPPMRLIIFDDQFLADVYSDGAALTVACDRRAATPLMFTSSGLGDHVVDPPRRRLFEQMFAGRSEQQMPPVQDAYHRHVWPDRRHESVCMYREDARTVSMTVVERLTDAVAMTYYPESPEPRESPEPPQTPGTPDRKPPPANVRLAVNV